MATITNGKEFALPLVDFGAFLSGSPAEKRLAADAVTHGFKTAGFIYLRNFGIASSDIQKAFSVSASFFSIRQEDKDRIATITPEINRGYVARGREKLSEWSEGPMANADVPDMKETFDIGREGLDQEPNRWPEDEEFKSVMLDFFESGRVLHAQIMSAIAVGLGLGKDFFDSYIDLGDNAMRLLHYPSVNKEVFAANEKQVRAGAHTDYGDITILFQDDRGGLQVRAPSGKFIDVTPIPGTVIVNAGDLLARWSNDVIKSTVHRVVQPPSVDGEVHPSRYSIAYFGQPNLRALIEGIPGTMGDGQENKYAPVTSGDYLVQRLKATYAY